MAEARAVSGQRRCVESQRRRDLIRLKHDVVHGQSSHVDSFQAVAMLGARSAKNTVQQKKMLFFKKYHLFSILDSFFDCAVLWNSSAGRAVPINTNLPFTY